MSVCCGGGGGGVSDKVLVSREQSGYSVDEAPIGREMWSRECLVTIEVEIETWWQVGVGNRRQKTELGW